MKISQLVIDTFFKVAKWGVNGNADFTVIGLTFRG
jgi:hypothetical protein